MADNAASPSVQTVAAPAALSQLKIDRSAGRPARHQRRRWVWWGVGALAVAVVAFVALGPRKHEVQATSVLSAYPSAQYAQLTASGYVVAQRRAAVASKATGRLVELLVREGSLVKRGEVLARLDAADLQAGVQAAQAGARQAEAGVRLSEAGLRQAQVEFDNAEAEFKRSQALKAQNFVSAQALDAAQRRLDAARASLASARAVIGQAQASLAQAQAQVAVQKVNEDFSVIRAPFDGVVLVKNANVGDLITPFSSASGSLGAVVTMADLGTLEVEADVSEGNVAKVKVDQPVEITLDALPDARFRGNVSRIVPTVDRAKATVMTKVRFEKLDARILPEMSAKVTFLSKPASDADQKPVMAVNPKAVAERDGAKVVLRIQGDATGGVLEVVPVKLGRTLGDAVELLGSPLKSGDKLVLNPDAKLSAGAKVAVVNK